jgi:hypothetical protein
MAEITAVQRERLNEQPPGALVVLALSDLLENDEYLLFRDVNERSITHRFAMYLQTYFEDWDVDCEYNRDGVDPKRLGHLGLNPGEADDQAQTVFPDVIVHRRGTNANFLVMEFKKSTNPADRNADVRKLREYKAQLGYQYALFVELGIGEHPGINLLEWI